MKQCHKIKRQAGWICFVPYDWPTSVTKLMVTGWITGLMFLSGVRIFLFVTSLRQLCLQWLRHMSEGSGAESSPTFMFMPPYDFMA